MQSVSEAAIAAAKQADIVGRKVLYGLPVTPAEFPPFVRDDGRRFHVRAPVPAGRFYGLGVIHVCRCQTKRLAEMVASALEYTAECSPKKHADAVADELENSATRIDTPAASR